MALPLGVVLDARPATQGFFKNPGRFGIRQLCLACNCAADGFDLGPFAFDNEFEGAKIIAVLEREFTGGREFQEQGILLCDQARSITPASPLSVPHASSRPSAPQASAVTGASPGFFAKISA